MLGKARAALRDDRQAWAPIRSRVGAKDDAAFEIYRRRYLEGAPTRPVAEEAADARRLFKAIAEIGGAELVGPANDARRRRFLRSRERALSWRRGSARCWR